MADVVVGTTTYGQMLLYDIMNLFQRKIIEDARTAKPQNAQSYSLGTSSTPTVQQDKGNVNLKKTAMQLAFERAGGGPGNQEFMGRNLSEINAESIRRRVIGLFSQGLPRIMWGLVNLRWS